MADPIMQVNLAICEGEYYSLWYDPADCRRPVTPRIVPPPEVGTRPEVIPLRTTINASKMYLQLVQRERKLYPSVGKVGEKFLRPTESDVLGPNSYLLVGEVTAIDRYARIQPQTKWEESRELDEWGLTFVVDCGLPVEFTMQYMPHGSGSKDNRLECRIAEGDYVEGLVTLWTGLTFSGLHQSVYGTVAGMKVLELDPSREGFGKAIDVPFGYKLSTDPDVMKRDTAFVTLDVSEIAQLAFSPFPARSPKCPEPDYPGMVHLPEDTSFRIVELNPPINLGET